MDAMTTLRDTPEYAIGYSDGMHGRPKAWFYLLDACYGKGYAAGMKAILPVVKHRWWEFWV